jgi:hypothetical protein
MDSDSAGPVVAGLTTMASSSEFFFLLLSSVSSWFSRFVCAAAVGTGTSGTASGSFFFLSEGTLGSGFCFFLGLRAVCSSWSSDSVSSSGSGDELSTGLSRPNLCMISLILRGFAIFFCCAIQFVAKVCCWFENFFFCLVQRS